MRRITLLTVLLGIVVFVMPTYVQAQGGPPPEAGGGPIGDLQNRIDAEEAARISADATLQSNIEAEATARQAADATLQSNIEAEATARQAADTTLQGDIDAEAAARQAEDTNLQNQIYTIPLSGLYVLQLEHVLEVGWGVNAIMPCATGDILVGGMCKFNIDPVSNGSTVWHDGPAYDYESWNCNIGNTSGAEAITITISSICQGVGCISNDDCHPECQRCSVSTNTCVPQNEGDLCESVGTCVNGECVIP